MLPLKVEMKLVFGDSRQKHCQASNEGMLAASDVQPKCKQMTP